MRNTDTFRQYIWIVNTILRSKKISLDRIQSLWVKDDLNDQKPLSRTTFYRLREDILDMFGIQIECDRTDHNQYYINNPETLREHTTQNWMLQTLTVNNILVDSLSIKDRLVLEEIPEGLEYLQTIINAIKNNIVLRMTHQGFDASSPKTNDIEPYCLKVFRQRWYLLGKKHQNTEGLRIYALDRIINLEETKQSFKTDPSFNAADFFKNYFGVFIGENEQPVRIVLRAHGKIMISLMKSLPKHPSQKEIATEKNYSDFEYFLVPSKDFLHDILKEGDDLEVLEPQSLRNEIKKTLRSSLKRYQ